MNPEIFELLLQNSHLGADRATAVQELFVVPPDTTQADEALQPHNRFVLILRGGQQHKHA